ncbi:MAG: LytR/AlgR family response regulator transcription factor [Chitinophagales bacterium]
MKLNAIIIDDEPMARKVLEEYIEDVDFLSLAGKAENPVKAKSLLAGQDIDLIFLDINMPEMSGIEFLQESNVLPPVILTTAYSDYALKSYDLDVLDYLVKPFSYERFLKACTKAKEYHELRNKTNFSESGTRADYFFVKCDGKIEKIFYDELIYVEAMQNYVALNTNERKMMVYLTIKGIEEQLPTDIFLKIHKSTIINTNKIKSIQGNVIDLGKSTVMISQNLYESVMNSIVRNKMIKR